MYKETCKTTRCIDFQIQKYSLSMTIQYHSDTLFLSHSAHSARHQILMGNTNVRCPIPWDSHRNDIPMDKPALCKLLFSGK